MRSAQLPSPGMRLIDEWPSFRHLLMEADNKRNRSQNPDLWRLYYPRKFTEISGDYYTPKAMAAFHLNQNLSLVSSTRFREALVKDIRDETASEFRDSVLMTQVGILLSRDRMPSYWVKQEIAEDLLFTEPIESLELWDMPLSLPAAQFMLPKGLIHHPMCGNVMFSGYARLDHTMSFPELWGEKVKTHGSDERHDLMVFFAITANGDLLHRLLWRGWRTAPKLDEIRDFTESQPFGMDDGDYEVLNQVLLLTFNLMALMTDPKRNLYFAEARPTKPEKRGSNEYWLPAVIGENYGAQKDKKPGLGGTHASPRLHRRRGHWNRHRVGVGRSELRPVWHLPT